MTANATEFRGTARFSVQRRLGEGGGGAVYEAIDHERQTKVALKHLHQWDADSLLRFKNEFRAMKELRHPNLVTLGELFQEDGEWFFTMEIVAGEDLLAYVEGTRERSDEAPAADGEQATVVSGVKSAPREAPTVVSASVDRPRPMTNGEANGHPGRAESIDDAPRRTVASASIDRLTLAMTQLARGLNAIHAAGKVHRDIKPSNVLVTRDGRVVILDFGLVIDEGAGDRVARRNTVVGTVRYMAPEQAVGAHVSAAADWYSFGVILYRALTGRHPIDGSPREVLERKQLIEPLPPSHIVDGVPRELDELCVALLRIEPDKRPSGREVLSQLKHGGTSSAPPERSMGEGPFVGRAAEQEALAEAFETVLERNAPVVVSIHGESGLGKSALVRTFADGLDRDRRALVLRGRCYERESVPYKAFDGIVDALSLHLARLPEDEIAGLVNDGTRLIPQLFPVLHRVEALASRRGSTPPRIEARELRTRVFAALRELLHRLAMRTPLVLVIDDMQWADADSRALFADLFYGEDPPPTLVVITQRSTSQIVTRAEVEEVVADVPGRLDTRHVHLEPLTELEAVTLAKELLVAQGKGALHAAEVVREASGHPMFVAELVRQAGRGQQGRRLDDALHDRVEALDPDARKIVEALAIAGAPLTAETVAHAVALELGAFFGHVEKLRADHFVRTAGMLRSHKVEFYHDRVRAAVVGRLSRDAQRAWHGRIALAIEAFEPDAHERLTTHWHGANQPERAFGYALRAAESAATALAFGHAAELYELALELGKPIDGERFLRPETERRRILLELARAYEHAGRSPRAGETYAEVSRLTTDNRESIELLTLAAEQFLIAGHLERGFTTMRQVADDVDFRLPSSRAEIIVRLLANRARLWFKLRNVRALLRRDEDISREDLARVDTGWSIGRGLSIVDPIAGAEFQARHTLHALRVGDPFRVCRALGIEAIYSAVQGPNPQTRHLVEQVDDLLRTCTFRPDDALRLSAMIPMMRGAIHIVGGSLADGIAHLQRGEKILIEECTNVAWELTSARVYQTGARILSGRIDEVLKYLAKLVVDARGRGDRYALIAFTCGLVTVAWLTRGEDVYAEQLLDESARHWVRDEHGLSFFYQVQSRVNLLLYRRRYDEAHALASAAHRKLTLALQTRVLYLRGTILDLRGRAALASAAHGTGGRAAMNDARKRAKQLRAEPAPWLQGYGYAVEAGIAAASGERERAVEMLRTAVALFEACRLGLLEHACRRGLGEIASGAEKDENLERATAFFRAEGLLHDERLLEMFVPGLTSAPKRVAKS